MDKQLISLIKDCKAYLLAFQNELKTGNPTTEQKKYYLAVKNLIPLLVKAQGLSVASPKENTTSEFHDLYNKSFDYLGKFIAVPQRNIQQILANQEVALQIANLYNGIPKETIERQGSVLASKKKAVDKWLTAFKTMLADTEIQVSLEKRFQELLTKANVALTEKGLVTVSIPSNNTTV